jgi:tRNA 2-thiouridine synthesizing protein A
VSRLVDARGLRCPLPLIRARSALAVLAPDETLIVLATDPEAPIDLGALAADTGRSFSSSQEVEGEWRFALGPVQNL